MSKKKTMSYKILIPSVILKNKEGQHVAELVNELIEVENLDEVRTVEIDAEIDAAGNPILKVRTHRIP